MLVHGLVGKEENMEAYNMVIGIAILAIVGLGAVLLLYKKRKVVSGYKEQEKEKEKAVSKQPFQKKVRIRVVRNERCQINIYCYNLEQEKLGELLAEYTWNSGLVPEKKANTVHLEQIFVQRRQRKKGIGKLMFSYLIQEMLVLEKQSGKEFLQIYGEVGKDGSDEPRSSIPFYKRMGTLPYGDNRKFSLQLKKGGAIDGLDVFTYHIVPK